MRRLLSAFILTIFSTLLMAPASPASARTGNCYICTSGSACGSYCRYAGKDTWNNRKKCRQAGCKIGGTASCPTGVNIKVCTGSLPKQGWRHAGVSGTSLAASGTSMPKYKLLANVIGDRQYH